MRTWLVNTKRMQYPTSPELWYGRLSVAWASRIWNNANCAHFVLTRAYWNLMLLMYSICNAEYRVTFTPVVPNTCCYISDSCVLYRVTFALTMAKSHEAFPLIGFSICWLRFCIYRFTLVTVFNNYCHLRPFKANARPILTLLWSYRHVHESLATRREWCFGMKASVSGPNLRQCKLNVVQDHLCPTARFVLHPIFCNN